MTALQDLREDLHSKLRDGTNCPVCGQFCKEYKRNIYSTQCYHLIKLHKMTGQNFFGDHDYFHITKIADGHPGDFAKLLYWGLIKQKPKSNSDDKRSSGYWAITEKGMQFVLGKINVPKYVYIYDGEARGFSIDSVSIIEALGKKFSYRELMK